MFWKFLSRGANRTYFRNGCWKVSKNFQVPGIIYWRFSTKSCPEKFRKFHGKAACPTLPFNQTSGSIPATLLKNRLRDKCFPVKFENFCKTSFYRAPVNEGLMFICKIFRALRHLLSGVSLSGIFCLSSQLNTTLGFGCIFVTTLDNFVATLSQHCVSEVVTTTKN